MSKKYLLKIKVCLLKRVKLNFYISIISVKHYASCEKDKAKKSTTFMFKIYKK